MSGGDQIRGLCGLFHIGGLFQICRFVQICGSVQICASIDRAARGPFRVSPFGVTTPPEPRQRSYQHHKLSVQ